MKSVAVLLILLACCCRANEDKNETTKGGLFGLKFPRFDDEKNFFDFKFTDLFKGFGELSLPGDSSGKNLTDKTGGQKFGLSGLTDLFSGKGKETQTKKEKEEDEGQGGEGGEGGDGGGDGEGGDGGIECGDLLFNLGASNNDLSVIPNSGGSFRDSCGDGAVVGVDFTAQVSLAVGPQRVVNGNPSAFSANFTIKLTLADDGGFFLPRNITNGGTDGAVVVQSNGRECSVDLESSSEEEVVVECTGSNQVPAFIDICFDADTADAQFFVVVEEQVDENTCFFAERSLCFPQETLTTTGSGSNRDATLEECPEGEAQLYDIDLGVDPNTPVRIEFLTDGFIGVGVSSNAAIQPSQLDSASLDCFFNTFARVPPFDGGTDFESQIGYLCADGLADPSSSQWCVYPNGGNLGQVLWRVGEFDPAPAGVGLPGSPCRFGEDGDD